MENYTKMSWLDFFDWIRTKTLIIEENYFDNGNYGLIFKFSDETSALILTSIGGMYWEPTPFRSKKLTPDNYCEDEECLSCNGPYAEGHIY